MSIVSEKAAYLRGLADGIGLDKTDKRDLLLDEIINAFGTFAEEIDICSEAIDLADEVASDITDLTDRVELLEELSDVSDDGDWNDDDDFCSGDCFSCPHSDLCGLADDEDDEDDEDDSEEDIIL